MDPQYNPDDIQAFIDAASNGTSNPAPATAPTAAGTPPASPDGSTPSGSLFGRDRYVLLKGEDGDYSVDLTTGIATPIRGLPGQAVPSVKKLVKTSQGYAFVDPANPKAPATPVLGLPPPTTPNVPAADQTMPGTGTPEVPSQGGSTGDLSTAYGDMYRPPTVEGTPATPDLTVAQFDARTRAKAQANTEANDKAARDLEGKRVAIEQINSDLTRGRDAVSAAYDQGRLTLDQAKQAADMLYQQADIELKNRIANQDFGAKMADIQMRRLPAGTVESFAPTAAAALQGRFVAPNIPQDTRDPTQIALNAIAQLKAGQGPQPAQAAFAAATPQSVGLTLPPAGGTPYTPAAQPAPQPAAAPPFFPRPGATTGPY